MPVRSKNTLQVLLSNDTLTLRGSPEESAGCILTGTVILNVVEPLKVKSLRLTFLGTVMVDANDGDSRKELVLTKKQWVFLDPNSATYWLKPNQYKYDFGIVLSGDFPESVYVRHGFVNYKVIAVAERPGLHFNLKAQRVVDIKRAILHPADSWITPHPTMTNWENRLYLSISVPTSSFIIGKDLPFSLMVTPLEPKITIARVKGLLREVVTYTIHDQQAPLTRYYGLSITYLNCPDDQSSEWELHGTLTIPRRASHFCNTGFIRVSHQLLLEHLVIDAKRMSKVVCMVLPVTLQSSIHHELAQSPPSYLDYHELPALEASILPPPYDSSKL
ncbi:hypothetical protein K7432_008857 [Basidiobolus ranarum]|uniref:Arrestin C-terminal-like domain-containing protein n=1 Tax=Basidiobolus ranarum TaxID=34480 RepID=A0ABR2VYV0_9FUNG